MPLDLEFGKFIKKIEGWKVYLLQTRINTCYSKDCINSRLSIGEQNCNCKDLDIEDGKCKQYKKRE